MRQLLCARHGELCAAWARCQGFRYSAVERTLWLAPKLKVRPFKTFFSTASGFGVITLTQDQVSVDVIEGELALEKLLLERHGAERSLEWKVTVAAGRRATKAI